MTGKAPHCLEVVLRHPEGRTERLILDADTVLVGSGAHCDVRLPAEHAAVEHVALSMVGGAVHARACSMSPHPTINGIEFVRTPVSCDALLRIGPVALWVSIVDGPDDDQIFRKTVHKRSPIVYVVAAVGLPIGIGMSLAGATPEPIAAPPGQAPTLWADPVKTCPQTGADAALALAIDKLNIAIAKRERRAFHVQDGVAAVPLFQTAAACFAFGGQPVAATDAQKAAQDLGKQVDHDYSAHAVRLEHALSVEDWLTARKEIAVLRGFTAGLQGPYVMWLSNEERRLALKVGRIEGPS